jgi:hypothetical protein
MAYDEATAERVRKLLSGRRNVNEKRMMGGLCFMSKPLALAANCTASPPDAQRSTYRDPAGTS